MYNFQHRSTFTVKVIAVAFMLVPALFFLFSQQPEFLVALVSELADATKSQVARMAAGLQLKNQLTSKDATVRLQYQQRWMTLDDKIKNHVKTMVRNLVELKCVLLYQVFPGFTPGLKLILIFTSRFCFTDDSNSRNGECETGYRSTGKFIIHHCFFFSIMRHFRVVLKKYPETMSVNISVFRKTSSSFRRDSNNTTQALRSKSEEVNLTTLSLFIVCLPPYLFTPGSEFN